MPKSVQRVVRVERVETRNILGTATVIKSSKWRAAAWLAVCAAWFLTLSGCGHSVAKVEPAKLPDDSDLCDRLDRVLDYTVANRHMATTDQAAWQVVHGALAFGRDLKIYHDGKLVSALDYLLAGGELRGWVLRKGDHGLEAVLEAGSKTGQGHEDQWLGYLSQCGLTTQQPIVVAGQTYTVADLITQAQWDIYDGMEATWTLMAFSTFLPLDTKWTAKDGTTWTIDRIVKMESAQDLNESACGGTHRMYALAIALNRFLAEGGTLTEGGSGPWELAQKKVDDAVETIRQYQQPDGSFSTRYFVRPATSPDIAERISTTGHSLEFLMVALDDEEFNAPWVQRAVMQLVGCLEKTRNFDLECGGLYHTAHALELYRTRRYGPRKASSPVEDSRPAATDAAAATP